MASSSSYRLLQTALAVFGTVAVWLSVLVLTTGLSSREPIHV